MPSTKSSRTDLKRGSSSSPTPTLSANYHETVAAVAFMKKNFIESAENLEKVNLRLEKKEKTTPEQQMQQMRLNINESLVKLINKIKSSKKPLTSEDLSTQLYDYTESLHKISRNISGTYNAFSYEIIVLKYNLGLAHFYNNCSSATVKTLKSIIRRHGNTPSENDQNGNDNPTSQEQYELLLTQAKQLYCEALLDTDDMVQARYFITQEIDDIEEGRLTCTSELANEIEKVQISTAIAPGKEKMRENIEQLIENRQQFLQEKRKKVEIVWRILYARLMIKEKCNYVGIEQLTKIRSIYHENSVNEHRLYYALSFYVSHLEFIDANRLKTRALLNTIPQALEQVENDAEKAHVKAKFMNNIAVLDMVEGNLHSGLLGLGKAVEELKKADVEHDAKNSKFQESKDIIADLKNQKKTKLSIMYNFAIGQLFKGDYLRCFEILTESILPYFPTSPRVWLRIAQCCVAAHSETISTECSFKATVFEETAQRSLTHLTNIDSTTVKTSHENATLEFGAVAIRNTLRLLVRYEAKTNNIQQNSVLSMSCKPGAPLTNSGHLTIKTHTLLAGAYIHLQLQNYTIAIEYTDQVLKTQEEQRDYYLVWLCVLYQAAAFLHLGQETESIKRLQQASTLVSKNSDDWLKSTNFWQSQLYDSSGYCTFSRINANGGIEALRKLSKRGTDAGHSILLSDINECRMLSVVNLAAVFCINGQLQKALKILEKVMQFHCTAIDSSVLSLSRQQFDSILNYIGLMEVE